MAKGEVVDFLKAYYRRLHTNAMPDDVLARLVDNKKKGILTPEQESWFTDGFVVEDNDPKNKLKYKPAEELSLSNTDELHKDELRKLYKRIATAMYGMKSASGTYSAEYSDVKKDFVNRYIDELKLFPMSRATNECEDAINSLLNILENNPNKENIKLRIVQKTSIDGKQTFANVEALDKFINEKLKTEKYNSDTTVQNKLKAIASGLYDDWRYTSKDDSVTEAVYLISDKLSTIIQDSSFEIQDTDIDDRKLQKFEGGYGADILRTIYADADVRDKFAEKDPDLVKIITDNAEGKISYQDSNSKQYLSPKTEDVLNPAQRVEKWATDSYNNAIRKFTRLRGDPLLFNGFAKEICKALDKEDIKPTDGLNGLLSKADAIKKRIQNKTVVEHFDWFVQTMNEVKDKYPKAVDGAWKNSKQMKAVITEIILKATGPKSTEEDMEKAKTTMQIMSAMKYGMVTSKVSDALKQTDFSLFGDKSLSWNNNEGIQFVTNALDKSIKFAFRAAGFLATMTRNGIFVSNMKFKNKDNKSGPLAKRIAEENKRLEPKREKDREAAEGAITNARQKISDNQTILDNLRAEGIDEATVETPENADKVQQFTAATKEIRELNDIIDKRQKAEEDWDKNNMNKVIELEDFWNFLQTGKNRASFRRTSKAQEKYDKNKEQWMADYVAKHGLRAA